MAVAQLVERKVVALVVVDSTSTSHPKIMNYIELNNDEDDCGSSMDWINRNNLFPEVDSRIIFDNTVRTKSGKLPQITKHNALIQYLVKKQPLIQTMGFNQALIDFWFEECNTDSWGSKYTDIYLSKLHKNFFLMLDITTIRKNKNVYYSRKY